MDAHGDVNADDDVDDDMYTDSDADADDMDMGNDAGSRSDSSGTSNSDADMDGGAEGRDVQVYRVIEASDDHQKLLKDAVPTGEPYLETWTDICVEREAKFFLIEDGIVLLEGRGEPLRAYTF
ncbi:hypothetical protein PsYK624_160460 [Phanerochaete sordida]|uniref:Uncharacterized protein n=1 Tax=Phanerochaete sordida TaxID=48140 RepID=A0A9P3LLW0_9APHY|nr:hypothetical protein PsYK624_160460 [Phanerochaete sordida]